MSILSIVIQSILGLGFLMFGLMKFGAKQMVDEFNRFRLPQWFRVVTGLVEIIGAAFVIAGIWNTTLAVIGGLLISFTMFGAILTHLRVKDSVSKAMMPIFLLILGLIVVVLNWSSLLV